MSQTQATSNVTPAKDTFEFAKLDVLGRLDAVKTKLLESDPQLETHLRAIHATLLQYEELVHVLTDEQISHYMAGMQKFKSIQLVKEATTSRKKGGDKIDDF